MSKKYFTFVFVIRRHLMAKYFVSAIVASGRNYSPVSGSA